MVSDTLKNNHREYQVFKIKSIYNKTIENDPRLNDDGTITTKHGHRIIPDIIEVRSGMVKANAYETKFQPRVLDIRK